MNVTRRGLLFGIGALAATAVLPRELVPLPETDMQRLMRLARTQRIIEDQTFLLDGPIRLDGISDLLVQRCQFIWTKPQSASPLLRIEGASCIRIFHCSFTSGIPIERRYPRWSRESMYPDWRDETRS